MKRLFKLATLMLLALPALGACHTVSVSGAGSKNGADWNNSYQGLPTTLTRGDVYYLADGTYTKYTFNTTASGATTSEIRKAQSYDNCTGTGWNTGTMGSSQAVFAYTSAMPLLDVAASYLIVNGNGQQTSAGCGGAPGTTVTSQPPTPTDCGIRLDNTACTVGTADACDSIIKLESGVTNYTFKYVEIAANGNNTSDTSEISNFSSAGTTTNSLFTHIYGHDAGCEYFAYGGGSRTVSFSYFWGTETGISGTCHGQYSFVSPPDSNGVENSNVYQDITGTAIWTFANPGTGTSTGWQYYNNVIWYSSPAASWAPFLSDGILACINSSVNCTSFTIVQNTIINVNYATGVNNENTGSYTIQNNLWYIAAHPTTFSAGTGGTYTQDHNSFLNNAATVSSGTCPAGLSGTSNVCDGTYASQTAPNPFTSWTTGNFALASDNSDWNNRLSLSAPYTVDARGTTFTTDRGAYQFVAAAYSTLNGAAITGGNLH